MAKIVYLAHPIRGEVKGNIKALLSICREIHKTGVQPFVPHVAATQYLDDSDPEQRALGMAANEEYLRRGFIDELWLCGPRISQGMEREIALCLENNIPVLCYNPELQPRLDEILAQKSLNK
jgi:hypothetical protein